MLRIKANGEGLDLPPDIAITLIIENPFFAVGGVPTPFSLTFNVDATPRNLRICGFPNRVNLASRFASAVSDISFGTLTFAVGHLKVQTFDQVIQAQFIGHQTIENLSKKLFEVDMGTLTFGTAVYDDEFEYFPTDRDEPGNVAYNYRDVCNAALANLSYYLAPVKVKDGTWQSYNEENPIYESATYQLYQKSADSLYLNFFDTIAGEFNLPRQTGENNIRPFFFPYLHFVFTNVFGSALENNPFSEAELADLLLITSYHPAYAPFPKSPADNYLDSMIFDNYTGQTEDFMPNLKLASYLPDMTPIDLLKNLMKIFCMSLYPVGTKYKLEYNKDILDSNQKDDWTSKLDGELAITWMDGQNYKYGYEGINDEKVIVKPGNDLATIEALMDVELTGDVLLDNFHITSTNEYYEKKEQGGRSVYTRLNSGFGNSPDMGGSVFENISAVRPLPMGIEDYFNDFPEDVEDPPIYKKWYVPEFEGNRMIREQSAYLMFARGMNDSFEADREYPTLSPVNYDAFGNRTGDVSLAWGGADGLIENYHLEFKAWIEKEKMRITGSFLLDAIDLKSLDLTRKKHIKGKDFLIERMQVVLTMNSIDPAEIQLVEV